MPASLNFADPDGNTWTLQDRVTSPRDLCHQTGVTARWICAGNEAPLGRLLIPEPLPERLPFGGSLRGRLRIRLARADGNHEHSPGAEAAPGALR
jgi:hypothetical protein